MCLITWSASLILSSSASKWSGVILSLSKTLRRGSKETSSPGKASSLSKLCCSLMRAAPSLSSRSAFDSSKGGPARSLATALIRPKCSSTTRCKLLRRSSKDLIWVSISAASLSRASLAATASALIFSAVSSSVADALASALFLRLRSCFSTAMSKSNLAAVKLCCSAAIESSSCCNCNWKSKSRFKNPSGSRCILFK